MKRFINSPVKAQSKFNRFANVINRRNLMLTPMRGGYRM